MNGVNKVAYQLAKTQQKMGHDVTVWGIANSLEHNYPKRSFKTKLFLQSSNKIWLDDDLVNSVRTLPQDVIVHVHGAFIMEFYLLTKMLKKQGIEYVFTPHGSFSAVALQKGKLRKRLYFSLFEKSLVENAKAVQLLGDLEFEHLGLLTKNAHRVLIPNGMELSELPKDILKTPKPQLTFGFCGRLDIYYKGLDFMLHGFALFLKKGYQAKLEIIGDGEDRKALEHLVNELGIQQHVIFLGAKYGDEKYRLMANVDVFLHTSRSEGFPMAVLEAAALGLPCLTSEGTNINSYIRQYAAGFPMEGVLNPEVVCGAMESTAGFYKQNKLKPIGANAKRMVQEVFDWRQICGELLRIYAS